MWIWLTAALAAPLTLDDAIAEALRHAPEVRAIDADGEAGRHAAVAEQAWINPSFGWERVPQEQSFGVATPIPLAGQPWWAAAAARQEGRLYGADAAAARARYALDVAAAWLNLEQASRVAEVHADLAEVAGRDLAAQEQLASNGSRSPLDLAVARAAALQLAVDASATRQAAVRARYTLEAALGRAPTGEVETTGWPSLPPPPRDAEPWSVRRAAQAADVARAGRRAVAASLVPVPSFRVGWGNNEGVSGPALGVDLDLPIFSPGAHRLYAADAEVDAAVARADAARLDADAAWRAAWAAFDAAAPLADRARGLGLDAAADALAQASAVGELALAEVLVARSALRDGLVAAIDAEANRQSAILQLWSQLGELPAAWRGEVLR